MADSDSKRSGTKSAPIIIQFEGSSFNAGIVLDETNCDSWSQIMEMHIPEKEKLSFIRGNSQPHTDKDDEYEKWYAYNLLSLQETPLGCSSRMPGNLNVLMVF